MSKITIGMERLKHMFYEHTTWSGRRAAEMDGTWCTYGVRGGLDDDDGPEDAAEGGAVRRHGVAWRGGLGRGVGRLEGVRTRTRTTSTAFT